MKNRLFAIILCTLSGCLPIIAQTKEAKSPPILQNLPVVVDIIDSRTPAGNILDLKITTAGEELFWNKKPLKIGWAEINDLRGGKGFNLSIWANPDIPFDKIKSSLDRAIVRGATSVDLIVKTTEEESAFKRNKIDLPKVNDIAPDDLEAMHIRLDLENQIHLISKNGNDEKVTPAALSKRLAIHRGAADISGSSAILKVAASKKATHQEVSEILAILRPQADFIYLVKPPGKPKPKIRSSVPRRPVPPSKK